MDEPTSTQLKQGKKLLQNLKNRYPDIKTMVTTEYQPGYAIDIYCMVADYFESQKNISNIIKNGKELWMYISCMSHGCGESRFFSETPKIPQISYHDRSGAPDLTIDASGIDLFAFYSFAQKYPVKALLYYNSIEQWSLAKDGVDIFKDMYNFGGNGDGTLIYPDYKNRKPLASLRLKLLREASFFHDALILSGQKELVTNDIKDTLHWSFDEKNIAKVYESLLKKKKI